MSTAVITSEGRVTIPADVRRRLGVAAGDRVEFVEVEGGFAIRPAIDDVRMLKGLLRKPRKPVSVEDMDAKSVRRRRAANGPRLSTGSPA